MTPLLALALLGTPQAVKTPAKQPVKRHTTTHSIHKKSATHSAEGITPARAREIQEAMVKAGLLDRASGHWDAESAAAMKKYQAQHGWQTRFVPDARALRALGLVTAGTLGPQ